jgi:hypothetical protein
MLAAAGSTWFLEILTEGWRPRLLKQGIKLHVGASAFGEPISIGLAQRTYQSVAMFTVNLTGHVAVPTVEAWLLMLTH